MLKFLSIRTKDVNKQAKKHYPLQTHLELAIMLKVHSTEQEPPTKGMHLVVCQEKCMNMGLVQLLVIKILIFHLLNLSLQNQPILNTEVPIP
jgi:hypothetical protein